MGKAQYGHLARGGSFQAMSALCAPGDILTAGEKDTGFDFQVGDVIMDAFVVVDVLESTSLTKTIDVGFLSSEPGGDIDGLLDGVSTAAQNTIKGEAVVSLGVNTYFFTLTTFGVLLSEFQAGSDVGGDEGLFTRKQHVIGVGTALSLVYQLGAAHTQLVADIYVLYFRPQQTLR